MCAFNECISVILSFILHVKKKFSPSTVRLRLMNGCEDSLRYRATEHVWSLGVKLGYSLRQYLQLHSLKMLWKLDTVRLYLWLLQPKPSLLQCVVFLSDLMKCDWNSLVKGVSIISMTVRFGLNEISQNRLKQITDGRQFTVNAMQGKDAWM